MYTERVKKVMLLFISYQCLAHSRCLIKYLNNERLNYPFYQSAMGRRGWGRGTGAGRLGSWTEGYCLECTPGSCPVIH